MPDVDRLQSPARRRRAAEPRAERARARRSASNDPGPPASFDPPFSGARAASRSSGTTAARTSADGPLDRPSASPAPSASADRRTSRAAAPGRSASASPAQRSRQAAGRLRGHLAVGRREPDERPRPGHDPVDVVAAAAGRQPAAAGVLVGEVVDEPGGRAHRRRRVPEVGERVPGMAVGAVLGDDEVRLGTSAASSGRSVVTAAEPGAVAGLRAASGTLTTVPAAAPSPISSANPVPGNRYRPLSWNDTVSTPGSAAWIASTPSPWWTSRSTYRTRSPSRRARAIASAGSS